MIEQKAANRNNAPEYISDNLRPTDTERLRVSLGCLYNLDAFSKLEERKMLSSLAGQLKEELEKDG